MKQRIEGWRWTWKEIYWPLILFPGVPLVLCLCGPVGVMLALFYWLIWEELAC